LRLHVRTIRAQLALLRYVAGVTADERETAVARPSPRPKSSTQRKLGRYEILRRLGSGAMGIVFEALDSDRNERVALKTLHKLDPSALYRLKNEFRTVADLAHPNLVSLHELVSVQGQWFMTMEFIDGVSMVDYVRRSPERVAQRARNAMRQLARGLNALHSAGKLHRDVKSPNVLVDANERTVLLDFGLAADSVVHNVDLTVDEGILGTPAYMSPEQACGESPTQASDWYAVGVILYECLCGELPYTGPTLKIIADKQHGDPIPISERAPSTPQDLAELCAGLLTRDPAARLDGAAILERLADDLPEIETKAQEGPVFVGREPLLRELERAFEATTAGAPVTIYVHGPSGIGKTALVDAFIRDAYARDERIVVLSGRCYERESVPYKAFDSLVDSLTRYLRRLPSVDAAALMPRDIHALARVFPVLERVPVVLEAPRRSFVSPDQQELRRRAFRGLREILAKIADRRMLILRIEDMQWGDEDSARLLADILAPPDPPAILLIGVYRNDEAAQSPMLRELKRLYSQAALNHDVRNLAVGQLSKAEARALALALLGDESGPTRGLAAMITRESDGSPLFVEELVRQVAISAASAGEEQPLDVSLEGVVRSRLGQLSPVARALVELLSVASRPLRQSLLMRAAGDPAEANIAMTQLRAMHMIRARGLHESATIECYHDRIRETVASAIPITVRREHHHALAEAFEVSGDADPEIIAQHYYAADERGRAAHYVAAAAERAAEALAFNRAAHLYRLARTWAPPRGPRAAELLVRHADALVHAGRCGEAAPLYLQAAQSAPSATAIELRRRAAEQLLVSGHIDEGVTILRPLLVAVGLSYPSSPRRASLSILARSTQLSVRGTSFRERDELTISEAELRRVDICWSASKGLAFVDPVRGYAFALRGLLLALQTGEPRRVARGLATVGMFVISRGGATASERGATLVREAEALAGKLDDHYLLGLTQIIDGIANVTLGDWKNALLRLDGGVQILHDRCAGIAWESSIAQMGTMRALLSIGRYRELKVRAHTWQREAEDAGDLYSEVWASLFWAHARLTEGDADEARAHARAAIDRWSHDGFHFQHLLGLSLESLCDLYQDRPMAAWNRLQEVWPSIERSQILSWQFLKIYALQLRGNVAVAAANATPTEARRLLASASATADELDRQAGERDDGAAAVSAIRAGIAATHGDRSKALSHLEAAIDGYEAAGMLMSAAYAKRRKGEVVGEKGLGLIAAADDALSAQGIADPARWTGVHLPGFAS